MNLRPTCCSAKLVSSPVSIIAGWWNAFADCLVYISGAKEASFTRLKDEQMHLTAKTNSVASVCFIFGCTSFYWNHCRRFYTKQKTGKPEVWTDSGRGLAPTWRCTKLNRPAQKICWKQISLNRLLHVVKKPCRNIMVVPFANHVFKPWNKDFMSVRTPGKVQDTWRRWCASYISTKPPVVKLSFCGYCYEHLLKYESIKLHTKCFEIYLKNIRLYKGNGI